MNIFLLDNYLNTKYYIWYNIYRQRCIVCQNISIKKGIVYKNQLHVIFCPKYRRKVLIDGVETRLKEILNEETGNLGVKIKVIEIMPDHMHIFIECDSRIVLHKVIKQLKGVSSRKLRTEYPWLKSRIPSLWMRSHFSCTIGHINEDAIIQHIEDQKHR